MNGELHPPGGPAVAFFRGQFAIDSTVLSALLAAALSRGGDYAALYFEHRESGNIIYE